MGPGQGCMIYFMSPTDYLFFLSLFLVLVESHHSILPVTPVNPPR